MIRPLSLRCVLAWGIGVSLLLAAPFVRAQATSDLTPELAYLRIQSLSESATALHDALLQPKALVLDLRYVANGTDAELALAALNSQPAKPKLYVLVSPDTPRAVATALSHTSTPLVLLGIKNSRPAPQVVVEQSAANDRKAYDAAVAGTPLADLISGKIEKERFDEASLVAEFKNGNHDAQPPARGNATTDQKSTERLTDRVLQRVVHLHRALQVLKKG